MGAGWGRGLGLGTSALPGSFAASDARADERMRLVELDRERVTGRRAVRGIRMRGSLKMSEFLGVAVRVIPPHQATAGAGAGLLEHRGQGLSVPLVGAPHGGGDVRA